MSALGETIVEKAFNQLQSQLTELSQRVYKNAFTDRAETAGGFPQSTLANAPLAVSLKVRSGDTLFITNGRKAGEGVGAGTGVPAFYNAATNQWLRFDDFSAVVV